MVHLKKLKLKDDSVINNTNVKEIKLGIEFINKITGVKNDILVSSIELNKFIEENDIAKIKLENKLINKLIKQLETLNRQIEISSNITKNIYYKMKDVVNVTNGDSHWFDYVNANIDDVESIVFNESINLRIIE